MACAAIGIICKTPVAGASKTRLAPLLGVDGAAELAGCFLRDVSSAIEAVPAAAGRRGYAVFAPAGTEQQLQDYLPPSFGMLYQQDATLSGVLLGATRHFLDVGHDCVMLINGDSPTMPPLALAAGLAALRASDDRVVLGPCSDGGYYLIGLKRPHAFLFDDIPWSTSAVLDATLARAAANGLEASLLPTWYDVDDAETFGLLMDEMAGRPMPFDSGALVGGRASATRAFFAARPGLGAAARRSAKPGPGA